MYENIPMELRERLQWVVAGPDKVPLNPRTGQPASVVDPGTWGTFNDACRAGMKHIGFVLTHNDPYCIIDLDNKVEKPVTQEEWAVHQRILTQFESYTERSASGRGYHVVIRGKLPRGRRRGNVEVYSAERYMVFTGDVVRNMPITEHQQLLDALVEQMPEGGNRADLKQEDGFLTDAQLVDMALNAANGAKFDALCRATSCQVINGQKVHGTYTEIGYPSQSEADFSLMSMLAFYSRDNAQCRRLFRYTGLGQRDKAQRDDRYLDTMLAKMRAKEGPPVDMGALLTAAYKNAPTAAPAEPQAEPSPAPVATTTEPAPAPLPPARAAAHGYQLPPGLIGELASYFHATAIRPVQEMALAAAIGLAAGVAGRAYNISGTGLNQYLLVLAKTGSGKEGVAKGIGNLMASIRPQVPMVDDFIGPGAFASGQALIRVLDQRPCFLSLLGEFGLRLQAMNDPRANAAERLLKTVLLDLYSKSGFSDVLRSTAYSDQEKNTKAIRAPAVTILGESTPETFYEGIHAGDIADGLIPRFHVIEYTGPRPHRNRNANCAPPPALVDRFADLVVTALTVQNNQTCQPIQIQNDALVLLDAFDEEATDALNEAGSQGEAQLWNRAHLKALKLAGLLAVGCDAHNPVVTVELATWAIEFTRKGTEALLAKFFAGEVGIGDNKQEADIRKVIEEYMSLDAKARKSYKVPKELWEKRLVARDYLWRRCSRLASFYKDKKGAARALDDALRNMVSNDSISLVPAVEAAKHLNTKATLYYVSNGW